MTTIILIAVTCIVSFLGFNNRELIDKLIFWPPAVKRGPYSRVHRHALIHADGAHLLFNMITLYFFGRSMEGLYERLLGPAGFALF